MHFMILNLKLKMIKYWRPTGIIEMEEQEPPLLKIMKIEHLITRNHEFKRQMFFYAAVFLAVALLGRQSLNAASGDSWVLFVDCSFLSILNH